MAAPPRQARCRAARGMQRTGSYSVTPRPSAPYNLNRRTGGYTLIELALAMGVLALLAGALLGAVGAMRGDERLEEGAERLATLMRMLRAEAANEGRRFRLVLRDPEGLAAAGEEAPPAPIAVEWEPQPLAQAGEFLPYSQRLWAREAWWELVRVERSERVGDSAYTLLSYESTDSKDSSGQRPYGLMRDEDPSYASITFNPDGSSDSARLVLRSTEHSDDRSACIELDGVTASVSLRLMTTTERVEWEESLGSP